MREVEFIAEQCSLGQSEAGCEDEDPAGYAWVPCGKVAMPDTEDPCELCFPRGAPASL